MRPDRTFIIAEAGVNHNGSLERALEMTEVAARAGADAVKFQTFNAAALVTAAARKASYQVHNTGDDRSQIEMLRRLELTPQMHFSLQTRCLELGIAFMSTAFDSESLRFLAGLDMPAVKVASGDLTAGPLLLQAARIGKPLIVSTGMASIEEIEQALGVIAFGLLEREATASRQAFAAAYNSARGKEALQRMVTLLQCVTEYPAPAAEANLRAMDAMRETFGLRVGYSDHTLGFTVALAAVARGATVLEKHFTLDRNLPGPDHRASLEPQQLADLVSGVREIEMALGSGQKVPAASELKNRVPARRSIVTTRAIRRGELFSEANLSFKRPGNGKSPMDYWDLIGCPATRDYATDEVLDT